MLAGDFLGTEYQNQQDLPVVLHRRPRRHRQCSIRRSINSSAHWQSSRITKAGASGEPSAARNWAKARTASAGPNASGTFCGVVGQPNSRASLGKAARTSSRCIPSSRRLAARSGSTLASAAKHSSTPRSICSGIWPPTSEPSPRKTRKPCLAARRVSSARRRDFPDPDSPSTRIKPPCPAGAGPGVPPGGPVRGRRRDALRSTSPPEPRCQSSAGIRVALVQHLEEDREVGDDCGGR